MPGPGAAEHRGTAADYSTQQAPPAGTALPGLGLTAWGDVEATGANPREKEECQQTRWPAGRVISATGQDTPDKPRQGQPGVRPRSGHAAVTRPARGTGWTTAPHRPTQAFRLGLCILRRYFFKKHHEWQRKLAPLPSRI